MRGKYVSMLFMHEDMRVVDEKTQLHKGILHKGHHRKMPDTGKSAEKPALVEFLCKNS